MKDIRRSGGYGGLSVGLSGLGVGQLLDEQGIPCVEDGACLGFCPCNESLDVGNVEVQYGGVVFVAQDLANGCAFWHIDLKHIEARFEIHDHNRGSFLVKLRVNDSTRGEGAMRPKVARSMRARGKRRRLAEFNRDEGSISLRSKTDAA